MASWSRSSPQVGSVRIPTRPRYFNSFLQLMLRWALSRARPFDLDSCVFGGCPCSFACWSWTSGRSGLVGRGWIFSKASFAPTLSRVGHLWSKRATVCNVWPIHWPLVRMAVGRQLMRGATKSPGSVLAPPASRPSEGATRRRFFRSAGPVFAGAWRGGAGCRWRPARGRLAGWWHWRARGCNRRAAAHGRSAQPRAPPTSTPSAPAPEQHPGAADAQAVAGTAPPPGPRSVYPPPSPHHGQDGGGA